MASPYARHKRENGKRFKGVASCVWSRYGGMEIIKVLLE